MFLQSVRRLVVFDESGFDRRFLSNLIGEMHPVSGAPVYTVYAMMDASNFDVVLFNENLLELARIPRTKAYSPFSWVESRFGTDLTPELVALYNPTRMIAEYKLIPIDYADYHIVALERQAALEAATVSMATALPSENDGVSIRMAVVPATTVLTENEESLMGIAMASSPPPPDGGTNSPPAGSGGGSSNLVMELAITMPLDCGPYAEIFQKQNLIYPPDWSVAVNKMAVTGGVETIWADPASSNAATMFYIVGDTSAGFDDGDGYSEYRERYVEGSNPLVFDMRDTDGDGMHDWHEIMLFGDLSQTGTNDFDDDGLANDQEMILHSNSVEWICDASLFDTDGDGTDDGTEVGQGSDPSNPGDGGQPPETTIVTIFLQNKSSHIGTDISMILWYDPSSYVVMTSTGTELNSNAFAVVKGRSYQLSLTQPSSPPYAEGYFADLSGAGVVVDDPDGILGDHDSDANLHGTVNTAAVHVIKVEPIAVHSSDSDSYYLEEMNGVDQIGTIKGSGNIVLKATITPDIPKTRAVINWQGATEDAGNPLQATLSRATSAKTDVCVLVNETAWRTANVWVVWVDFTEFNNTGPTPPDSSVAPIWYGAQTGKMNGALIQSTISPSGFYAISNVSFDFKQTIESGLWKKEGTTWTQTSYTASGSSDGPHSQAQDITLSNENHIYMQDNPGYILMPSGSNENVFKLNAVDAVYIKFGADNWIKCSSDYLWYSIVWLELPSGSSVWRRKASETNEIKPGSTTIGTNSIP